jgi:cytochrome c oxidase cbb3-type subunit III
MAEDKVIHEYDGIEEYDNSMPNWWLTILWVTLAFGTGYWGYTRTLGLGKSPEVAFAADLEQARARARAQKAAASEQVFGDDELRALSTDPATVAAGATAYKANCLACHGDKGQGMVGPNLTDSAWIHGGSPLKIHYSIDKGWPNKGMMPWGKTLGTQKVRELTAFVLSIAGTNVPGKAPQGVTEATD